LTTKKSSGMPGIENEVGEALVDIALLAGGGKGL
jgi:hypothetical protein